MPKSPFSVREVIEYLRLEDVEDLVPGSVKYVGAADEGGVVKHYWSYPGDGEVQWTCLEKEALGFAERVPDAIRGATSPYADHPKRKPTKPPHNAWTGRNLPEGASPLWIPSSMVHRLDAAFVASFEYDFDQVAKAFGATPSTDKYGGGAGPCRYFILELPHSRLAMLEYCKAYKQVHLHLPVTDRQGTCYWEDYFQIVDPLDLRLEQVFRQGGVIWKHRKPSLEALERTRDHQSRMWLPR